MISPSDTVSQVVDRVPAAVRVFQRHGIDFCCGGGRMLSTVCAGGHPGFAELAAEVAAAEAGPGDERADWSLRPIDALIDHILAHYHVPAYPEFERLAGMVDKVRRVHHDKDPELFDELDATWRALVEDLVPHFRKEEMVLFPMLRRLAVTGDRGLAAAILAGPVGVMLTEHEAVGRMLARLRALTGGYRAPEAACRTWRALWEGLAELEQNLHLHIHLENNVLFRSVEILAAPPLELAMPAALRT